MVIQKAYKLKLRPNKTQEKRLLEIADGCRYVWNYYLNLKKQCYLEGGKSPSYLMCAKDLTYFKKDKPWLEGFSQPLQQALRDQDAAYKNFFSKIARFPRFKSKRDTRRSFRMPITRIKNGRIMLERGMLIRCGGTLPPMNAKIGSITFSRDAVGTWWASILTEQNIKPKKKTGKPIGIDLGLNHLAILSTGKKYDNIRPRKKNQEQMKQLQRLLARKEKGSNARTRAKVELARLHRKIGNVRSNYLHHVSRSIVDENQATTIFCEDLAVKNMSRNHRLAYSIVDASWAELIRRLEYKQRWNGGELVKIDRFFPSSKMCSNCGFIIQKLPLIVRAWDCPVCASHHDRDVNAAKVIAKQGAACQLWVEGKDGSPVRGVRVTCPKKP